MGLLPRREQKSRKKRWLVPVAFIGAVGAAVGLKRRRSTGAEPDADADAA